MVNLQLETLGQYILQHDVKVFDARRLLRFGVQIEELRIDPRRTSGYLFSLDLVGDIQIGPEGDAGTDISSASRSGTYVTFVGARLTRLDRCDFERQRACWRE